MFLLVTQKFGKYSANVGWEPPRLPMPSLATTLENHPDHALRLS